MTSPYTGLPARQFWRTGVREMDWSIGDGLYRKKFEITNSMQIMTAGSCFAQHIARRLKKNGYSLMDGEPVPEGMSESAARNFGYGIYSARYGNVYTARQLRQLVFEAFGKFEPREIAWEKDGHYFDALRPAVEPDGLDSEEEVLAHRKYHLQRVRNLLENVDLLIFTFGLTEGWRHTESGTVYPTAPGTIAGSFDPSRHSFVNFGYEETLGDFEEVRSFLKSVRPDLKFLVTVSPVPLTATWENAHVLSSTVHSKSILRAVAGALAARYDDVDYFPSYELIATPFVGSFYDESLRTVTDQGVERAMGIFFGEHGRVDSLTENKSSADSDEEEAVCEEILLEAFAP